MHMPKAPDYWSAPPKLWMKPLEMLYGWSGRARQALITPLKLPVPVICIGNVVAGGAGKTPVVIAFAHYLQAQGHKPHILTRGYGGNARHPVRVEPHHIASEVGDEALLLAKHAPCWVDANRRRSASLAMQAGATHLLMDDGFQNPSLHKDLSVLVIDGGYGFGNGALIPAGPLRELPGEAFKRAQAVVMIGRDIHYLIPHLPKSLYLLRGTIQPQIPESIRRVKLLAFCGIGRPQKFYDTLRDAALQMVETQDFPDHHNFTPAELNSLLQKAQAQGANLVTTEKDWVRLSFDWQEKIICVPITLSLNPTSLMAELLPATCS